MVKFPEFEIYMCPAFELETGVTIPTKITDDLGHNIIRLNNYINNYRYVCNNCGMKAYLNGIDKFFHSYQLRKDGPMTCDEFKMEALK